MPSTSQETHDYVFKLLTLTGYVDENFGLDEAALRYLRHHGFILHPDWSWQTTKPINNITVDEWAVIKYLIEEWDFGSVEEA